jgi:esterase/lipase superfamily enzyme
MLGVKYFLVPVSIGLALALSACAGRLSQGMLVPVAQSAEGTSRVQILAATTRQRSTTDAGEMFSGERATESSYAAVTVSIPPDNARKFGEIQWPESLPGDPGRNFVTVSANYLDKPGLVSAVSATAKQTGRSKVVIFVHGFNNRFDDAVYRFAQIVHDAKAPGIPVLFTWPSRGELKLRAYTYDRESANYSRDAFEELLATLTANPNVKEINIVAHSMGNWVTLEALRGISIRSGKIGGKIRNVLLVAPDVDVDVFRTQIQRMGSPRPRFALFVSQDDKALELSQTIWGGVPRLGEINPAQEPYQSELKRENIEVFDLTTLKGNAHDRAFENITAVVAMLKNRVGE